MDLNVYGANMVVDSFLPNLKVESGNECESPSISTTQCPNTDCAFNNDSSNTSDFNCVPPDSKPIGFIGFESITDLDQSASTPEFVMSSKGLPKLIDRGSMFLRYRVSGNKISWRCELSSSHHCKAKLFTDDGVIVKRLGEHSHAGNAAKIEIAKMMEAIYKRAQTTNDSTSNIVTESLALLSPASVSQLPTINSIKRVIHRNRSKKELLPPLPTSSEELVLLDEYQCTECGGEFLRYDETLSNGGRYLLFASDGMLEKLARCRVWFVDSSFQLHLSYFSRICVVLGVLNEMDVVVPLAYALMGHNSEEGHEWVLIKLRELEPSLYPKTVFTDYNLASYSAVKKAYPAVDLFGCFFQFCQIYYGKVQALGLQDRYQSDAEFALKLRLLPSLAFLPSDDVTSAFENIAAQQILPPEGTALLDHFEDAWIGRPVFGKARRTTVFPLRFWNCVEAGDLPTVKLNALFEAWHRYFANQLSHSNTATNVWKLIKLLKNDAAKNETLLTGCCQGEGQLQAPKWQPKLTYKKLENILATRDRSTVTEYLNSVASCLFF